MTLASKTKQPAEAPSVELPELPSTPFVIEQDRVPLRIDQDGVVRVGPTRVTIDTVLGTFRLGASPEEIVRRYPTLRLADVYSVIGYYLRHQEVVDTYLRAEAALDAQMRQAVEALQRQAGAADHTPVQAATEQE